MLAFLSSTICSQTPPEIPMPVGTPAEAEVRFAALGDAGTGGGSQQRLADRLAEVQRMSHFEIVIFLGDNVYPSGSPSGFEDKFLRPYAPLLLAGVEFRGAIGNHDARDRYGVLLQQMVFGAGPLPYYSFTEGEGLVEFFGLDTTKLSDPEDDIAARLQVAWLDKKLAASDAEWQIAFMHHPLYSSSKKHGEGSGDMDELLRVRNLLEPVFVRNGLEISLSGHDHVYERTKPIKGIQYFISGAGGKLREDNLQRDTPYFAAGYDTERSFVLVSVMPDSVSFWSINEAGTVVDSGTIRKGCGDDDAGSVIRLCAGSERDL